MLTKGQGNLDELFSKANSSIRYNNIYQKIIWDLRPTNEYLFDQTKGIIKYQTDNPEIHAIATPEILGTFNLDDKTFLWADKNESIQQHLSDKVKQFRSDLPHEYQQDKFISNSDLNENLLSLFSFGLNANGFDTQRQDNTIIYFSLMHIDVFENGKIKYSIRPESHFEIIENERLINTIKQFHREMVEINDKYYNKKELTDEEAFKAIQKVHLKYWLNEDEYYYPALSWPCDFDEKSTSDWKVVNLKNDTRIFVVYTANLGWTRESYAYEIEKTAKGDKIIINLY
jgi:hypothetical protein